jgi:hypothetical protein
MFTFLLQPHSLIRVVSCNSVQNSTFHPELLDFWTLSIVRYCKNISEHNASETESVSVLRCGGRHLLCRMRMF